MKKTLTLTLSCLLTLTLFSQPVITSDWIFLESGVTVANIEALEAPDPGPSGANVTWDFSKIQVSDTAEAIIFHFADPDTTPYGVTFPEANLVQISEGGELYNYYRLTSSKLENLGFASEGASRTYTNPATVIEFPMTYQDNFDDTYSGTFDVVGFIGFLEGSTSFEADAYGTLILPQSTFNNVLRFHSTEHSRDSIDLGLGIMSVNVNDIEMYNWISPDHPGPLASYSTLNSFSISYITGLEPDTTILEQTDYFSFDSEAIFSSTREVRIVQNLTVSPNPVVNFINLNVEHDASDVFTLRIIDASSRSIHSQVLHVVEGKNNFHIDAPKQNGLYFLLLESPAGQQAIPFIK